VGHRPVPSGLADVGRALSADGAHLKPSTALRQGSGHNASNAAYDNCRESSALIRSSSTTCLPRRTFTGMAPRGIMAKVRAQKMPSVSLVKGLDPGRAAEHGFQIRKDREGIEVGMHKGEIFDIR
jgi:hypothetical protein